ncbi:small-conductance mechanosensitive channel [Mycobacterium frederiksbergense]|uniref:Small-conductance mechanosensitive channel n=1 Tax=Mycolicibacterium frederiksbergense TaxID=117567 RepID=A0ABT6LA30_9MYCO|nr:hypothetical protein [Mycolicibacterium frederiksbergense]MDH6199240.1 small-conductance mechanosensitive channel [Mycolicibacterium frederiksbergense]
MSKNSGVPGKTVPQAIRAEAARNRQLDRALRTAEQQIALLDQRPGQSARERARLAVSA